MLKNLFKIRFIFFYILNIKITIFNYNNDFIFKLFIFLIIKEYTIYIYFKYKVTPII